MQRPARKRSGYARLTRDPCREIQRRDSRLVVSLRSTADGWVWYETSYNPLGTKKSIMLSDLRFVEALGLTWWPCHANSVAVTVYRSLHDGATPFLIYNKLYKMCCVMHANNSYYRRHGNDVYLYIYRNLPGSKWRLLSNACNTLIHHISLKIRSPKSLAELSWVHSMEFRTSVPQRNSMDHSIEMSPLVSMLFRTFLNLLKFLYSNTYWIFTHNNFSMVIYMNSYRLPIYNNNI